MASRCFVVKRDSRFNMKHLELYGKVHFLTSEEQNLYSMKPSHTMGLLMEELERQDYNPMEDYIVLTGPNMALSMLSMGLARKFNQFKILVFNAPTSSYRLELVE